MSNEKRRALRPHRSEPASEESPKAARLRYRICGASELAPGDSIKFLLPIGGVQEECFLINYQGVFHAYVNRCRHVPIAMDWVDNQFFAEQGRYLMCQTHNAYYEPDTGECIAGPRSACGKSLFRVPIEIDADAIFAHPERVAQELRA
ncbi:MAG TPA: Rieske 2Fe-2S domain-containing protein [Candidatus Binataceae bacterium]|jgi:nitrite reductase/ring-hydroxylating ferredoxin subunit